MKSPRGFVSLIILLAIVLGVAVLGGGAYYLVRTPEPSAESATTTPESSGTDATNPPLASERLRTAAMTPADQALMRQIGCSDAASCIAACTKQGMTAPCKELQNAMSAAMQSYTAGVPTGAPQKDVANVGNNTTASAAALPDCPAGNAVFDHSPLALTDLSGVEPLGHMNGEHILPNQADHVYLDSLASLASAPVYAPGDVTILAVAKSVGTHGIDTGANTVKIYFSPCKSLMFAVQINKLAPGIASALANMKPANTQAGATVTNTMYAPLAISVKGGDLLGTLVNDTGLGGSADFAAVDVRTTPLQFIDQGEGTGFLAQSYQYTVCPLDYFTSSLKSALYAKLTIKNAGANGIPACGAIMQDEAGTAQGNWYDKSGGAQAYQGINEASLLAFAHYNLDPSKGIVSVGTDLIPTPYLGTQLIFTPQSTGYVNREPSQITPGQVYCFDGPLGAGGNGTEGHIDIRLDSATTLEADHGRGACAAVPALGAASVTYER